jgi:hypothetical protein
MLKLRRLQMEQGCSAYAASRRNGAFARDD